MAMKKTEIRQYRAYRLDNNTWFVPVELRRPGTHKIIGVYMNTRGELSTSAAAVQPSRFMGEAILPQGVRVDSAKAKQVVDAAAQAAGVAPSAAPGNPDAGDTNRPASADTKAAEVLKRGWKIIGDFFHVTNSAGKTVTLKIAKADQATHAPTGSPFEPVGQDDMIFSLALGIKLGRHVHLQGPTGISKTTGIRWLASMLNYNLVIQPISRGTQDRHLIGEYLPAGPGEFLWTDGQTTLAARLSRSHPTILLFDEINRIGNIQELACTYGLLDDTRMVELPMKRNSEGAAEQIDSGELFIFATSNPADDEGADYIGVRELDPALNSRFAIQPILSYPDVRTETKTLMARVEGIDRQSASSMCKVAKRIRESADVRYAISFRELMAWAESAPFYTDLKEAAESTVISKCPLTYREACRNLLVLAINNPELDDSDTNY